VVECAAPVEPLDLHRRALDLGISLAQLLRRY
jgi:hypothetical protein